MTTADRKEILELLAKGKITADEAADLLTNPQPPEEPATLKVKIPEDAPKMPKGDGHSPSWLHVRVKDLKSGRNKVTVNIPIGMMKFGLQIGRKFSPELDEIDWNELTGAMQEMESGVLVDVQDEEDGEHVQVYVD